MKKTLLSIALALVAPFAWGQTSQHHNDHNDHGGWRYDHRIHSGKRDRFEGNQRAAPLPVRKTVTYVTKSGKTLDEATVKTRIKVGIPIHVHYSGEGENLLVDRVVLDDED